MSQLPIFIAVAAVFAAAILYFVFLPHVEGPSLDEQKPDRKSWLVRCPNCNRWQTAVPRVSTLPPNYPTEAQEETKGVTNRFICAHCKHRWDEVNKKL